MKGNRFNNRHHAVFLKSQILCAAFPLMSLSALTFTTPQTVGRQGREIMESNKTIHHYLCWCYTHCTLDSSSLLLCRHAGCTTLQGQTPGLYRQGQWRNKCRKSEIPAPSWGSKLAIFGPSCSHWVALPRAVSTLSLPGEDTKLWEPKWPPWLS